MFRSIVDCYVAPLDGTDSACALFAPKAEPHIVSSSAFPNSSAAVPDTLLKRQTNRIALTKNHAVPSSANPTISPATLVNRLAVLTESSGSICIMVYRLRQFAHHTFHGLFY